MDVLQVQTLTRAHCLNNLGCLHFGIARRQEIAVAAFVDAVSLAPDSPLFVANLGSASLIQAISSATSKRLRQMSSLQDQAIATLMNAVHMSPGNHRAYNNLGIALAACTGYANKAAAAFARAVTLAPEKLHAAYAANLGLLLLGAALADIDIGQKTSLDTAILRTAQAVSFLRCAHDAKQTGHYYAYKETATLVQRALVELSSFRSKKTSTSWYDVSEHIVLSKDHWSGRQSRDLDETQPSSE